ncbi:plasmid mobilization protein [Dysosmobacter sp.]
MSKQTHRTCVRMSAKEYSRLMERSKEVGLSANAWLMAQLIGNRPIISRDGVIPDFLRLLNQKGREINTVARAFNSGYGTAEGLRQALDCLKDIAQTAYEVRKEGFTHAP